MPTTDELAARLSNAEGRIAVLDQRLFECARGRMVAFDWCYELSTVIDALAPGALSRSKNLSRKALRDQAEQQAQV
jgi:hypothetical protein